MSKLSTDAGTTPNCRSGCILALVDLFLPLGASDHPLDALSCPGPSRRRSLIRSRPPPTLGPAPDRVAIFSEVRSFEPTEGRSRRRPAAWSHWLMRDRSKIERSRACSRVRSFDLRTAPPTDIVSGRPSTARFGRPAEASVRPNVDVQPSSPPLDARASGPDFFDFRTNPSKTPRPAASTASSGTTSDRGSTIVARFDDPSKTRSFVFDGSDCINWVFGFGLTEGSKVLTSVEEPLTVVRASLTIVGDLLTKGSKVLTSVGRPLMAVGELRRRHGGSRRRHGDPPRRRRTVVAGRRKGMNRKWPWQGTKSGQ